MGQQEARPMTSEPEATLIGNVLPRRTTGYPNRMSERTGKKRLIKRVFAAAATATAALAAAAGINVATPGVAHAATSAAAATTNSMPCASSARACVDLSRHEAWLSDGAGHVVYGPVAARGGTSNARTPTGTFHVLSKDRHFYSTEFDAPMPYSVFFYPGDAFHADNTSVNSNGCIHLSSSSAQHFFNTLHVGDEVQIVG
jgi:lipoprotein-anchoring transpeptidase ErfK/SrfK